MQRPKRPSLFFCCCHLLQLSSKPQAIGLALSPAHPSSSNGLEALTQPAAALRTTANMVLAAEASAAAAVASLFFIATAFSPLNFTLTGKGFHLYIPIGISTACEAVIVGVLTPGADRAGFRLPAALRHADYRLACCDPGSCGSSRQAGRPCSLKVLTDRTCSACNTAAGATPLLPVPPALRSPRRRTCCPGQFLRGTQPGPDGGLWRPQRGRVWDRGGDVLLLHRDLVRGQLWGRGGDVHDGGGLYAVRTSVVGW